MTRRPLARLRALFVPWTDARIVFHDDAIIAVDKPPFIPTHGEGEGRGDDVVARLAAYLGKDAYLGTHQRLDRDTSGVLVFARSRAANPSLARQFEGRTVEKTYLAVVEGDLRLPEGGVLRHLIAPDQGGRVRALASNARNAPPDAKPAATAVRIVRREGQRALLEAKPETGRTHQIRAQLAAAGAPIVGDVLYDGAPAQRLMLHASRLSLDHPTEGRRLDLSTAPPPELALALEGRSDPPRDVEALEARLRAAADRRYALALRSDTDAFRIASGEADGLPGLAVDVYGDDLVVHLADPPVDEETILDAVARLGADAVYVKRRPKDASHMREGDIDARAPREPVRGAPGVSAAFVIEELGVPYEVDLGAGMSTGIFLDQRENRRRVREMAAGARVLNLFSYSGAFSVAAARGGARTTSSIDASANACAWARRNLARVGADETLHTVVVADAFEALAGLAARRATFDLVILDPPSFSTTKTNRFTADGGYVALAASALQLVAPGGALLACTNHQGIVMAKFRRFLHEAARAAAVSILQMKDLPPPEHFPPAPGKQPHLKSVLVRRAPTEAARVRRTNAPAQRSGDCGPRRRKKR